MTRKEAKEAMKNGKKLTHRYFKADEWITINARNEIITELGYKISPVMFWLRRNSEAFDKDWSIFKE